MFWFRCLAVLELPGAVFFVGMERGTPEEGGIGPGVDGVVDAVEVLWGDVDEGRQRKVESVRGWMELWMLLRFCGGM